MSLSVLVVIRLYEWTRYDAIGCVGTLRGLVINLAHDSYITTMALMCCSFIVIKEGISIYSYCYYPNAICMESAFSILVR